jgi:hypothetical protein
MKQARVLAFCSLGLVLAFAVTAGAAPRELKLGTGSGRTGQNIDVPLTMNSDGDVQGFVAAFDWDGAKILGMSIAADQTTVVDESADVVVTRIEDSYAVIGVVMDSDGVGGEIIPAGNDIQIAVLTVNALGPSGDTEEVVPVTFKDKVYNTVDLGPLLDNIIVIGGLSIGLMDGLVLTDGNVHLLPPPPGAYYVNNTTDRNQNAIFGDAVTVPVLLGNNAPVQGFVVAIQSETGITLTDVTVSPEVAALVPDFAQANIFGASGGVLAVVFELDGIPPFNTIPIGSANKIGLYKYATPTHVCVTAAEVAAHTEIFDLTFVDFVYGDPAQENVIVIGGQSKNPELNHGKITLKPKTCPILEGIQLAIGSCELVTPGIDEPVEDWDIQDPTDPSKYLQRPGHIAGDVCDVVQVGFYYKFPPDTILDELDDYAGPDQIHQIQGLSIAVCYDKNCLSCLGTFSLAGTITETIGAEFVNVHCEDTDQSTGDVNRPGELVIGILADALPPFEGQYLPPTSDWLKLICVNFQIPCDAPCDGTCSIYMCDGANGRGTVPIKNVASVWNHSWPIGPYPNADIGTIEIRGEAKFIRGDCNFNAIDHEDSADKSAVDIADASAILSYLFQDGEWQFIPPCLDACDANDDGRVDLADSVFVLRYLFKFDRQPPEPFDVAPGTDPTDDRLDCAEGHICP